MKASPYHVSSKDRPAWYRRSFLDGAELRSAIVLQEDVQRTPPSAKDNTLSGLIMPKFFTFASRRLSCRGSCNCCAHAAACGRQCSAGR